ncbi:VOC family protein [Streptomyces sp. NPDC088745]|uniref:VOC family protein n=1 Tax=Streptomyces sp. NPDC088745 TaxID=3365884 RepID=UPI003805AED0
MNTAPSDRSLNGSVISYAIWAADGRALAAFYAAALGGEVGSPYPDEQGNEVAFPVAVGDAVYVFWTSAAHTAPDWPHQDLPFHLDLAFPDVAAAEKRLLDLGATKPDFQPGGEHWTVLLDPSGQPLCISRAQSS